MLYNLTIVSNMIRARHWPVQFCSMFLNTLIQIAAS